MPYDYYQFVRFVGRIGFAVLSYQANQQGRQRECDYLRWTCFVISTVFQYRTCLKDIEHS